MSDFAKIILLMVAFGVIVAGVIMGVLLLLEAIIK